MTTHPSILASNVDAGETGAVAIYLDEARAAGVTAGTLTPAWQWMVGTGSALAVKAARRV